jgi:hypothetical protein
MKKIKDDVLWTNEEGHKAIYNLFRVVKGEMGHISDLLSVQRDIFDRTYGILYSRFEIALREKKKRLKN